MKILHKIKFLSKSWKLKLAALFLFIPLVIIAQVFASHSRVNLFSADNFAILAGTGITDVGASTIVGNVGLSPATGAGITGLTCAEVSGTIYDVDGAYAGGGGGSTACRQTNSALLTTAKNDLTTAYNDAAGRPTTSTVATELGGTTLTDGTYDSASGTFEITGTLTLNGQGNSNSVFIFKMASTLVTASASRVILINGAQACNVYWQVGSSATLGTGTNLVGNVLALTTITDNGSSTVLGRLLARNGAVNTNNTNIVVSGCASGTSGGSSAGSGSGSGASTCPPINSTLESIVESRRIDADSIFISWGPYFGGENTFIVQYGPSNGNWLYSTNVTGFSTTLNGLSANQPVWVRIAARNNCAVGSFGLATLVGGPALPNTGAAPSESNIPWVPVVGIFSGISFLALLIKRKNAFSSKS